MAADETRAKKSAKLAANAHTNLNTFGAVIAILEGGCIYGATSDSAGVTANKLIKLCQAETHRQLVLYDRHLAAVDRATEKKV
jgi:hypothetical protein